jgi:hypothetical protein
MFTMTMEQLDSSLQNQREKNGVVYCDCSVMITHRTEYPIRYAIQKYHNMHLFNKPSMPQDPLVLCDIKEPKIDFLFTLPLPAKQVINNSDGDVLQFYAKPGALNFKNKDFKKKPVIFTVKLAHNPNLYGKTFTEQLERDLHNFFIQPSVIDPDNAQELENAGIITSQTIIKSVISTRNNRICYKNKQKKIFSHGPHNNGSNKEKIIVAAAMPSNQNKFLSLQCREMNGTFRKDY